MYLSRIVNTSCQEKYSNQGADYFTMPSSFRKHSELLNSLLKFVKELKSSECLLKLFKMSTTKRAGIHCSMVNQSWSTKEFKCSRHDPRQEPTESSKQPIRNCLGHVTGDQPIRYQYFLVQSVRICC